MRSSDFFSSNIRTKRPIKILRRKKMVLINNKTEINVSV